MVLLTGGTHCGSRALLTASLRRYLGEGSLPQVEKTPLGKPWFPQAPNLHVSLSHSGDLVLCALSGQPVGVDIEMVRPRRKELPRYALTKLEFAQWERQGATWSAFYALWTRKEAWCKLTGEGLSTTLRQEVPQEGLHWSAYQGEDWTASLCGGEDLPHEILWLTIPQE